MRSAVVFLAGLIVTAPAAAQQRFDWYGRGPYRPAVPRPDSLLGHGLGTRHTMYFEQQRVLDRLIAAAPERVRTEEIGSTTEGKVMRVLIISAPENLARLDQIRADIATLGDPRKTTPSAAAAVARGTPAIALLSHSIHGNEPAGFEAVMQTAYQLLASDEAATLDILKNVIVILNPSQNPDGHERFAAWNNGAAVGSDEPGALEQSEPWSVWGRFNHYRFDMNRDFIAQSQAETRALMGVMVKWHPQLVIDLHSTTAQYFFPPTSDPLNPQIGPWQRKWEDRFGRGNAAAFDRFGWAYFNRDTYDFFYPGYVDLWPSMSGATGMTFETDGGPELKLRKGDGTITTFADGIAHHFVASLASLGVLAQAREERLKDYYEFHATGLSEARSRAMKRVVIAPSGDPVRALKVAQLLARGEVEIVRTTAPYTALAAHDYMGSGAARRTFPAGSYVIDLAQPQARLATTMLEPRAAFDSAFTRRQLEKFARNQRRGEEAQSEGYDFYDITAWSMAYSFGLDAAWTEDLLPVSGEPVTVETTLPPGSVTGRGQSAYLWPGGRETSTRLALSLLREHFAVGVAMAPIRADGATWAAGTFVARVGRNAPALHERVSALAAETRAQVTAVASAFVDSGQGVGSDYVQALHEPKILLAAGDGVSTTTFGDVWFYLEQELHYPVVPVDLGSLGRVNLSDYNLLILPDGSGSTMLQRAGDAERIKRWVQDGGAIIGIGNAYSFVTAKETGLSTVGIVGGSEDADKSADKSKVKAAVDSIPAFGAPIASPTAPDGSKPEYLAGLIARATLDKTHWLTFGYVGNQLPVFLSGNAFFTPSKKGDNPVAFAGKDLILSGFAFPGNTERLLSGAVWATVESAGQGKVVLFADDPLFRAFWRGTAGLFNNAILMAPGR